MKPQRPYKRTDRVGNQLQDMIADIARKHIDLSHLGFITFTRVDIAPDLRSARIFFSVLNPTKDIPQLEAELNRRRKAFKKYLAPQLHIKYIPDLRFIHDDSIEYGIRMEQLLRSIDPDKE